MEYCGGNQKWSGSVWKPQPGSGKSRWKCRFSSFSEDVVQERVQFVSAPKSWYGGPFHLGKFCVMLEQESWGSGQV